MPSPLVVAVSQGGPALAAAVPLEWAVGAGKALGLLLWLGTGIRALCHTGFIPSEGH